MKIMKFIYFLVGALMFSSAFLRTHAAIEDPRNKLVPYLNLEQANIHDVLRILFKISGAPYTLESNVQGFVTVKLENQPFETVLRNILNQIGATYRVQDGVYEIVMRPVPASSREYGAPAAGASESGGEGIRRIFIQSADPQLIMTLLTQTYGSTLKLSPEISVLITSSGAATGGGFSSGFGGSKTSTMTGGFIRTP